MVGGDTVNINKRAFLYVATLKTTQLPAEWHLRFSNACSRLLDAPA